MHRIIGTVKAFIAFLSVSFVLALTFSYFRSLVWLVSLKHLILYLIICTSHDVMHKRPETAAICPNKQCKPKVHLFFLSLCQEGVNVILAQV